MARRRLLCLPLLAICGVAMVWFIANLLHVFRALLPVWLDVLAANHGVLLMPFGALLAVGFVYGVVTFDRMQLAKVLWLPGPLDARLLGGFLIGIPCIPGGVADDLQALRRFRHQRDARPLRAVSYVRALPQASTSSVPLERR